MSNTKTVMSQAANTQGIPLDITDVFSTYLYTGNGAIQDIKNGIALGKVDAAETTTWGPHGPSSDFLIDDTTGDIITTSASMVSRTGTQNWSYNISATGYSFKMMIPLIASNGDLYIGCMIDKTGDELLATFKLASDGTISNAYGYYRTDKINGTRPWHIFATDGTNVYVPTSTTSPQTVNVSSWNLSTGTLRWGKLYNSSFYTSFEHADIAYYNGAVYHSMRTSGKVYLMKLDPSNGSILDYTSWGNGNEYGSGLGFDPSNNDVYQIAVGYQQVVYFRKYDSDLNLEWQSGATCNEMLPNSSHANSTQDIAVGSTYVAFALNTESSYNLINVYTKDGTWVNGFYTKSYGSIRYSSGLINYKDGYFYIVSEAGYIKIADADMVNGPHPSCRKFPQSTVPTALATALTPVTQGSQNLFNSNPTGLTATSNSYSAPVTTSIEAVEAQGGMVWVKSRSAARNHNLTSSELNVAGGQLLSSNTTDAVVTRTDSFKSFNSDGFTVAGGFETGNNGETYASWTFRKAPKFFDVVTYTGDGTDERQIAHNLGGPVGCLMVKCTSEVADWQVLHKDTTRLILNTTATAYSVANTAARFGDDVTITRPTSTHFTVSTPGNADTNKSGASYVAYLFAHNDGDGGFGPDGDADIIKCGSYTGDNSGSGFVDLGWEPQWILIKKINSTGSWYIVDNTRGWTADGALTYLLPSADIQEFSSASNVISPAATGFSLGTSPSGEFNTSGNTYIYIAIRRGSLAPPESGTEVFAIDTESSTQPQFTSGFPVDTALRYYIPGGLNWELTSRLTQGKRLIVNQNSGEGSESAYQFDYMDGWEDTISSNSSRYSWMFRRAPNFFDVVAYTGDGVAGRTVSHNLGVAPEMIIVKDRANSANWAVQTPNNKFMILNSVGLEYQDANTNSYYWGDGGGASGVVIVPTDTDFTVGPGINGNSRPFIAYLFATLAGVSKVGSYTGNGSSQTIDCGFTSGARFILIKRTDSTGDWYIWDTERGIVAGNDPHLSLNTTAAEVTSDDSIDPDSSGFIVNQLAATNINVSSASYIFYAIA